MISDVRVKGNYIEVYDEKNEKISYMSVGIREIVCITGNIFIVYNGSYIEVYDEKCEKIFVRPKVM